MKWHWTPYTIPLLVGVAISAATALHLLLQRRRDPLVRQGILLLTASVVWMLGSALELASVDLADKVTWQKIQWIGICIIPTIWFTFSVQYTGRSEWLTPRARLLLGVPPVTAYILVATNEAHGLMSTRAWLGTTGSPVVGESLAGAGLWAYLAYAYVLVLAGILLLIRALLRSGRLYRWQGTALILAVATAWLANAAVEVFGFRLMSGHEVTPLALGVAVPVIAWTLNRLRSQDIVLVARDTVLDGMEDAVIVLDTEGLVVDLNPAAQRLIGVTRAAAYGQSIEQSWPGGPEQIAGLGAETSTSQEVRLDQGGSTRVFDLRVSPLLDWQHRPVSRVIVLRDITERQRTEQALRENQARYRAVVEQASEGIVLCDTDTQRVLEANSAYQHMLGYGQDELQALTLYDIVAHDRASVDFYLQRVITDRRCAIGERQHRRKDGSLLDVDVSAGIVSYEGHDVMCVVARDISERKRAESRLARLNECLLQFGSDPDENINRLVAVCGELLGATCALYNRLQGSLLCSPGQWRTPPDYQSEDQAQGHICYDVIRRGSDLPVVIRDLAHSPYAATDPNVARYGLMTYLGIAVKVNQVAVGSLCVVYQKDLEPREEDQHLMNIVGAAIGVEEERKQAEDQIRASLQDKEVLLKEVLHRVKNNLQIVSSLLNLQAGRVRDQASLEVLRESQNRIRSMSLIHEKLYQSSSVAQVDLAAYVQELAEALLRSYQAEAQIVRLGTRVTGEARMGLDTAIPCGLIVNELVSNALKHAFPPGRAGEIWIEVGQDPDGRFRLTVGDNGVGLPDGLDVRRTESLGLQLVVTLINQLDGSLELRRTGGTIYSITFADPRAQTTEVNA